MSMDQEIIAEHKFVSLYKDEDYAVVDVDGFPYKINSGELVISNFSSNKVMYSWFKRHNLYKDSCKVLIFLDDVLRLRSDAQEAYIAVLEGYYNIAQTLMPDVDMDPFLSDEDKKKPYYGTEHYKNLLNSIISECKKVIDYVDNMVKSEKGCKLWYYCGE